MAITVGRDNVYVDIFEEVFTHNEYLPLLSKRIHA